MVTFSAIVEWSLGDGDFASGHYSRGHTITLDGGLAIPGTASPQVVKAPWSVEGAMDPEQAFIAAISQCHMLWFLDLAKQAGFSVERYRDEAHGVLARISRGKQAVTKVTLRPQITFTGERRPSAAEIQDLHHQAHEVCFIANSVKTEIVIES